MKKTSSFRVNKSSGWTNRTLTLEFNDRAAAARCRSRRVRLSNDEAIGLRQRHHHGTVLNRKRRRDRTFGGVPERGAQVIGALVVLREVRTEQCRFGRERQIAASA